MGEPQSVDAPRPDPGSRRPGALRHRGATPLVLIVAVSFLLLISGLGKPAISRHAAVQSPEPRVESTVQRPSDSPVLDDRERAHAVNRMLQARAAGVLAGNESAFLESVDPTASAFLARQTKLIRRLAQVGFAEWSYELIGPAGELSPSQRGELPAGSAVLEVRLIYQVAGTRTRTEQTQYLTVVPGDDRWLIAADGDEVAARQATGRDIWDLGPVRVSRGDHSTVVAAADEWSAGDADRVSEEADAAVRSVREVWRHPWSEHAVVVLPSSQEHMAVLLGRPEHSGLRQIAAVTTGLFDEQGARGDRILVNPGTFRTLRDVGRQVVLTHEVAHVATRESTKEAPPAWLSEGFADYVAYRDASLPPAIVAGDLLDDVRSGLHLEQLPTASDFDTGRGDVAGAYEGAWLACRFIAQREGVDKLVAFYRDMSDGSGPGWPVEARQSLGMSERQLTSRWRNYVGELAGA